MVGIYLLISLYIHFAPHNLGFIAPTGPSQLIVKFDQLNGIRVGAPVLAEGQLIGTVSQIDVSADSASNKENPAHGEVASSYTVVVKIAPRHRTLLRRGTVALIASPLSATRIRPETVVELLIPPIARSPVLETGDRILGYSSYETFWSADLSKLGPNQFPFLYG